MNSSVNGSVNGVNWSVLLERDNVVMNLFDTNNYSFCGSKLVK